MKECKVVQDLLPNYIENLTNEETNKFIEEHLKNCEQCKKIYDNMKKDLNVDNKTKEKKKVKFLKKYRNKLRVLEIILLIIVVAFVINTGRKMYIIADLNNKSEEYVNSENYHRITYSLDNGNYTKSEIFSLGDKKKLIITTMTEDARKQVVTIYATKTGTVPDTEYATTYTGTSESSAYKPGDATYETSGWHGDDAYFVWSDIPFFIRGGWANASDAAGVFCFDTYNGNDYNNHSFRLCLAVK